MLGRLMPREGKFFDLFSMHAERIVEGGRALVELMTHYDDPHARARHIERIDDIEKAADKITHETTSLLHRTFVTPFDRESIHLLINRMDDILDLTQDVAESLMLYDIQRVTPEAHQLAELAQLCGDRVRDAVELLHSMGNAEAILAICQDIDRLESDADRVMRSAMSRLFREEANVRELIKMRAIYELLESITDKCEDVANVIEGVVLENA